MSIIESKNAFMLIEHFPKSIVVLDNDIILYANTKFLKMMNISEEATLLNKSFSRFIHPSYLTLTMNWLEDLRNKKESTNSLEIILFNVNNKPINIEIIGNELSFNEKKVVEICISDISERKRAEAEIQLLTLGDISNKAIDDNYLNIHIQQIISSAEQHKSHVVIARLEINDFRLINEIYGRKISDALLQEITERLEKIASHTEMIFPLGAEQYVIILKEISNLNSISSKVEEFLDAFSQSFSIEAQEILVTVTIGMSVYPDNGIDAETLITHADLAKFYAKQKGTNKYQFFTSSMASQMKEQNNLLYDLRRALLNNEFRLLYQPIIDTRTRNIVGLEALLRWWHDEKMLSPVDFLSLAEEVGLIFDIGKWVIKTVCYQNIAWQKDNICPIPIAVNLSMRQLRSPKLINELNTILEETKLSPRLLSFEMSEKITVPNETSSIINYFNQIGIDLTLDDFGVSNFSLHELKNYHIANIKINRSLIEKVPGDKVETSIVEAIIAMAKKLDITVIAQGVETKEQLQFLNEQTCFHVQGHYFSSPLTSEQLHPYLIGSSKF